jgi:DNA integrity scanning protein DisA with diadenylate cyclase activity
MRREKTQLNEIRNEQREITNTKEIQGIITDYFKNQNSNKLENVEEMDKFQDHPKLNQEDINHLNRSMIDNEIKGATESLKKDKFRT